MAAAIVVVFALAVVAVYVLAYDRWAANASVSADGERLVATSARGARREIAARGLGSVSRIEVTSGGTRETWLIWLSYEGVPTYLSGRGWPIDQLERLASDFGLTAGPQLGPVELEELARTYPQIIKWHQVYAKGLAYGVAVGGVLILVIALAALLPT